MGFEMSHFRHYCSSGNTLIAYKDLMLRSVCERPLIKIGSRGCIQSLLEASICCFSPLQHGLLSEVLTTYIKLTGVI